MEVIFNLQFGKTSVEVLCGHCMPPVRLGITPPHNHRQGELHVMLSGRADYTVGTENRVVTAGDFFYIPSKIHHSAKAQQPDTAFITFTVRNGPKQPVFSSLSPALSAHILPP